MTELGVEFEATGTFLVACGDKALAGLGGGSPEQSCASAICPASAKVLGSQDTRGPKPALRGQSISLMITCSQAGTRQAVLVSGRRQAWGPGLGRQKGASSSWPTGRRRPAPRTLNQGSTARTGAELGLQDSRL